MFANCDAPDFQHRVHDLARNLRRTGLRNLWISLDSADPELHESRRGLPGVVRGIEAALPILAEHDIYPAANLGVSRLMGLQPLERFDEADPQSFADSVGVAARQFFRRTEDLGFTMVNLCYPMSRFDDDRHANLAAVYGATSHDDAVAFSPKEKVVLYRALKDAITEVRPALRIFTPLSSLEALASDHERDDRRRVSQGCRGGVDYFYISPAGVAYPCGYRGAEPLGPFWDLGPASCSRPTCRACDWECFRDPSQLFGQLLDLSRRPLAAALRARHDDLQPLWLSDVRYALACRLFDGRRPHQRPACTHIP
jgi:hypothetical protein